MQLIGAVDREPLFEPGIVFDVRTDDFDTLASVAPGWSQEYQQLGRGPFHGALQGVQTASAQFGVMDWRPGLMTRGSIPAGCTVFGVPLGASHAMLRGAPLARGQVGLVAAGEELDFRAVGEFRILIASVDATRCAEYAELVLGLEATRLSQQLVTVDPESMRARCERFVRDDLGQCLEAPDRLREPGVARRVEAAVLELFLGCVRPDDRWRGMAGSARLARQAEDWMRANLDSSVGVRELCAELGVPERTLHLAFRRHRESSPMQHFKTLRLNAAHRALRDAEPGIKVTDVALRWGFDHLGWFAHDYRRMFGCTPSETLRRAQARGKAVR